jgi:hypothetical protein
VATMAWSGDGARDRAPAGGSARRSPEHETMATKAWSGGGARDGAKAGAPPLCRARCVAAGASCAVGCGLCDQGVFCKMMDFGLICNWFKG